MLTPRQIVIVMALPVLALGAASAAGHFASCALFRAPRGTFCLCGSTAIGQPGERDLLWAAVRDGDPKKAKELIDKGANVNAKNEIGVTALWIAAGKRNLEVVELLIRAGADVNARDLIWYETPLSQAVGDGQAEIAAALVRAGAKDIDAAVIRAASSGKLETLRAVLDNARPLQEALDGALFAAPKDNKDIRITLEKAGAAPVPLALQSDRDSWKGLAGSYESENGGKLVIDLLDSGLAIRRGNSHQVLKSTDSGAFRPLGLAAATYTFDRKGDAVYRVVLKQYTAEISYYRLAARSLPASSKPVRDDAVAAAPVLNWPALRGEGGTGIADGQHPPISWNAKDGTNVLWKTPIPGLGHSSPIVWGDRVFLTTAISGDPNPKVRTGNYGDVDSVNDTSKHTWQVLCLDRVSGKILWMRTAFEGVPKIKRHLKGSQANCTPATDGRHVVACFGSEGLYCYDFDGKQLWKRDLSFLDSSFAIDQNYEWGFGSSPVIHDGMVILQCDLSKDSFVAAYSLEDGARVWSTPRDEIPSWSSPVIWRNAKRTELVTNASQYARGYDPATGKELWRLEKKSEVAIPMPVVGPELVYISSGNRPIQPIFAIRPGAAGDISLQGSKNENANIAWSKMRGGPYMTTPILYREHLYVCSNAGILTCYEAATGKEIYKERLGGTSYTASPIAADGRLYFTSEQGSMRVIKAGMDFEILAVNELDDVCMATPAISGGTLFVRSQHYLFALKRNEAKKQ
jgi:outer membrane protein assembly factor BamB